MKRKAKCIGAAMLSLAMVASVLPTDGFAKAESAGTYSFIQDYTLGYSGGVVVYRGGSTGTPVGNTDVPINKHASDNPFAPEVIQDWNEPNLKLTQPVQYTTSDGKVHNVESMLTNFNFIADPASIDNSDVDGKLYVYATTEAIEYKASGDNMSDNAYNNHSLTILSTEDMVNWTDEGFIDNYNLTNEPSDSDNKVKNGWGQKAWAPSGLKIDGDGDGDDEYYMFYTNGGAVGYVQGESPVGPWNDDLGKVLFTQSSPNCSGVVWCFDPGVIADDKGDAYVYFGGGTTDDKRNGKTGRVCKIKFEEGTGFVSMDGEPQVMETYYLFEDSEINQFNGLYYYSYCTNFNVPGSDKWIGSGHIAAYISSDPMNIAFMPDAGNGDEYTDEDGTYHRFLGTILKNPSTIYGQSYNNHHRMLSFKGKDYILYHSTVLNNTLHRYSAQYRNMHVDEINIDAETKDITIEPTYEGASQIEAFNPYKNFDGSARKINATTTSYSAGVKSRRSDSRVKEGLSPMVLEEIQTGDWTKLQGVDFGSKGAVKFEAEVGSWTSEGAIEIFLDDPTVPSNMVGSVNVTDTSDKDIFTTLSCNFTTPITGEHDVYFIFRGEGYDVATWTFVEKEEAVAPTPTAVAPTPAPTAVAPSAAPTAVAPSAAPTESAYTVGKLTYKVTGDSTVTVTGAAKKSNKTLSIPATVKINGTSYKVTAISTSAFKGYNKLTSITIGKNVKAIGSKAFNNCTSLKKVTLKATSLTTVGSKAFKGIYKKATIKVPSKKLSSYKKILKGKGQGKNVRIR